MSETLIIYGLVAGFIFLLAFGMRWLAPHLDRWGERMDAEEAERRRPKTPRPPYPPPSQYPKITSDQVKQFEQAFDEGIRDRPIFLPFDSQFVAIGPQRIEPDIEDEP